MVVADPGFPREKKSGTCESQAISQNTQPFFGAKSEGFSSISASNAL